MTIELPSISDWQKFKNLWLEALTNDPQAFGYSYAELANRTMDDWQKNIAKHSDASSTDRMFIAKDGDDYIGMMGYFKKSESIANIFGVYVKPEYRGKKISNTLLNAAINSIKQNPEFTSIRLEVNTNQEAAVELYKRNGFTIVEEIKDVTMGDGTICNEYLMTREIK